MSVMIVPLPNGRSYPIEVVQDGLQGLGASLKKHLGPTPRVHLVTNPVVGELYLNEALKSLRSADYPVEVYEIPDGEREKSVATWHTLVGQLLKKGISRSDVVMALGGGVTGDIAGFAAATVLRGVRCVQIPTTLLAMVDSAVGGKTGVNGQVGKNLIGAFHQPSLVYSALSVLNTLDDAEWRCGLGEVVKHGIIADEDLFSLCEQQADAILNRHLDTVEQLVINCCAVKSDVVAKDEREGGWRKILNFGHTVGHALESGLGHGTLRHGECVAIGMLAETAWAVDQGLCDAQVYHRLDSVLERLEMCRRAPEVASDVLADTVAVDKKREGGTIEMAMPIQIGTVELHRVPIVEVLEMLNRVAVAGEE